MSRQRKKLKVRPVPPATKGSPFRAYVSAQVLEQFGGKSETVAWVLGKLPVPVTLWREQPQTGRGKQDPLGNNVIQLSETVRKMARTNLEDPILLIKEESPWAANADLVTLEEPEMPNGTSEASSKEARITRKAMQEPVFQTLLKGEVAVCGQQVDVYDPSTSANVTYTVRQVNDSSSGGLYWITDDTRVEILPYKPYTMAVSRARIGGLEEQLDKIDWILEDYGKVQRPNMGSIEHYSDSILLTGPPGGGKTLLMEQIARLDWPKIFRLRVDSRTSLAADEIRNIVYEARHFPRALILIDEVDKIAGAEKGRMGSFATDLLHGIKALREDRKARILLIAASRDPEDLHARLREADGFDYTIRLGLPKIQARAAILKIHMAKAGPPDEALDEIARRTHAFAGRELVKFADSLDKITTRAGYSRRSTSSSVSAVASIEHSTNEWLVYAEQALKGIQPYTMQGLHVEIPETRFSDVGGHHELKERLDRDLRQPIMNPERFTRLGIEPLKGLLMYGPPGCAKTLLARAIATEFRFNFLLINASELISSYVGESEKRIRELFQQARDASPCILFFDEFDTIGAARGGKDAHGGLHVVQTMLTEMDGVRPLEEVFVLAATNDPEALDPALLRPGRLYPHVLIGIPDVETRNEILNIALRKLPEDLVSVEVKEKLGEYAQRTEGFTGAQVRQLAIDAVRLGQENVGPQHFETMLKKMAPTVGDDVMDRYREWRPFV